jgi:multimeric flavodoxin WrbA
MNVLVINGSPRGTHGTTWWVLDRLIQGMEKAGAEVETVQLAGKKIAPCSGDLACWFKTPGECIHRDDVDGILAAFHQKDLVVIGTPVYVDGMTGLLKNCIDRLLPLVDPRMEMRDGHLRHPAAGPLPPRVALVATCGFAELDNFDPLVAHVKAICRNMNAAFAGALLRPQAPVLPHVGLLHPFKIHAVTKAIKQAGEELVRGETMSEATLAEAAAEIVGPEDYAKHANQHFEKILMKAKS